MLRDDENAILPFPLPFVPQGMILPLCPEGGAAWIQSFIAAESHIMEPHIFLSMAKTGDRG